MDLKTYLRQNGLKQNFFADKVGVTQPTLSRVLHGHDILISMASRICEATLGVVTLEDLLPKKGKERPTKKKTKKNPGEENAR
jgi:transcriptional regulator with XRE-family HTH domain